MKKLSLTKTQITAVCGVAVILIAALFCVFATHPEWNTVYNVHSGGTTTTASTGDVVYESIYGNNKVNDDGLVIGYDKGGDDYAIVSIDVDSVADYVVDGVLTLTTSYTPSGNPMYVTEHDINVLGGGYWPIIFSDELDEYGIEAIVVPDTVTAINDNAFVGLTLTVDGAVLTEVTAEAIAGKTVYLSVDEDNATDSSDRPYYAYVYSDYSNNASSDGVYIGYDGKSSEVWAIVSIDPETVADYVDGDGVLSLPSSYTPAGNPMYVTAHDLTILGNGTTPFIYSDELETYGITALEVPSTITEVAEGAFDGLVVTVDGAVLTQVTADAIAGKTIYLSVDEDNPTDSSDRPTEVVGSAVTDDDDDSSSSDASSSDDSSSDTTDSDDSSDEVTDDDGVIMTLSTDDDGNKVATITGVSYSSLTVTDGLLALPDSYWDGSSNPNYNTYTVTAIGNGTDAIFNSKLIGKMGVTTVYIPDTVTSVESSAFSGVTITDSDGNTITLTDDAAANAVLLAGLTITITASS